MWRKNYQLKFNKTGIDYGDIYGDDARTKSFLIEKYLRMRWRIFWGIVYQYDVNFKGP